MNQVLHNPVIVVIDESFGYTAEYEHSAGRDLTEREFKKWYDHMSKNLPEFITTVALYSDDEGVHEITADWFFHEMNMWNDARCVPFN